MHDITRRGELAQQLRWLFTGRISNDESDDFLVDSGCPRSHDRMIVAIADWAWTQYSDTFPYHLTGKNAASDELKSTAALHPDASE